MDKLSVTIITRNEERNLERCLNALNGLADEVVVVDSYSTDATVEICRRYGCRVVQREFRGFGAQRQYATGLTSNTYVLSLDADEVIDEQLRGAIMAMKREGFAHRVYSVEVINYFCGCPVRHSGLEPTRYVRLFNKRYANWDLRHVSDTVSYPAGVIPEMLPGSIHHYRCASMEEFNKKENRIASLQARALARTGGSISPVTPLMLAVWQYVKCQLIHKAWLDGSNGHAIARRRSKTVFEAYRMARHLIHEEGVR